MLSLKSPSFFHNNKKELTFIDLLKFVQQRTERFSYIILHNPDDSPQRHTLICVHLTDEEQRCCLAKVCSEEQIQDSDSGHLASEVLLSNTTVSSRDLDLFHFIRHLIKNNLIKKKKE